MFTNLLKSTFSKAVLAAVVMGGALFFAGAPNARPANAITIEIEIAIASPATITTGP